MRKNPLVIGELYHVFNKSIANYTIFNDDSEFLRILNIIRYYQIKNDGIRFSSANRSNKELSANNFKHRPNKEARLNDIIAYCFMPTHFHLIIKQLTEKGTSIFMNNIQNSYTRYFNIRHNRKGPLWEGPFKSVLVGNDEQLLHLTRYIHLNPVTAFLVNNPEDWKWSSYGEFTIKSMAVDKICYFNKILNIDPDSYKTFVTDRIEYQRNLAKIKNLLLE